MRPQEIISKKRDGETLSADEIKLFVQGVCDGSWADYQISAFIMACFTRGLNTDEQRRKPSQSHRCRAAGREGRAGDERRVIRR